MRVLKNISWLIFFTYACGSERQSCDVNNLQELNLYPVQCIIKLPAYKIVDSMRYDDKTILSYDLKSFDSSISANCFIKSYVKDSSAMPDIQAVKDFQKQEVEFGRDSVRKITEEFKIIEGLKVGYLKYLVTKPEEKFYEGRIFFYKGKMLVTLWIFERTQSEEPRQSTTDCIVQSLKIKS